MVVAADGRRYPAHATAQPRIWQCVALTDIWTGDAERKPDRLITTGLLGSIRWWFEVLVRGLDGRPCDPSQHEDNTHGPCPEPGRKLHDSGHHCIVCELFGCTGWARKFRFDVLDDAGGIRSTSITSGDPFSLRFTPLRDVLPEEWALLDATIRLIAEYGAIGGKTVLKPSHEKGREGKEHHRDFGLFELRQPPALHAVTEESLRAHVTQQQWRSVDARDFAWASLQHFWFVGGAHLSREGPDRSTFNKVLGRDERKTCVDCGKIHGRRESCPKTKRHPRRHSDLAPSDGVGQWLAGDRGISKKVFSFKNPARTFGFIKPGLVTFAEIRNRLRDVWPDLDDEELVEGPTVLRRILDASVRRRV